ncbi:MAG: PP2C family protein-serine/threonine phosphatase [Candidatus Sulfopaludibacter sp.]|nr:PP2C family protein-serine/threonine phosphatase [Candidatus Sulfopaludibacter sp.]
MSTKTSNLSTLELEVVRDVQARFLPYRLPRIQGLDYCGDSRPAGKVGGDFFDFTQDGRGGLVVSVGEVSGQGIAAAILMSGIQSLLRGLSSALLFDPVKVVRDLNRTVYEVSPDNFFTTLFYARVDAAARQLQYVSAGHEPALLIRADGHTVQRLESTGAVLGLTPRVAYSCRTLAFEPGDMLIAFTDGIPDVGIPDAIRRNPGARASDLVALIMEAADTVEAPADDHTVIVVRCEGAGVGRCC